MTHLAWTGSMKAYSDKKGDKEMFGLKKQNQKKMFYRTPSGKKWMEADQMLREAHVQIAGSTGSGKSTMIHSIMWTALSYAPSQKQFIILDMKMGLEMARYEHLPHTLLFAETDEEAISALNTAINIITKRGQEMKQKGLTMYDGSDIYVVIDELGFLLQACGNAALQKLMAISRIGRACRVHLIGATQDPSKASLPAAIQQNMTCCIGLKCRDAVQSRQIISASGCENLPDYGQGIMLKGSSWTRIGIYKVPDEDLSARINYWSNPSNYIVYQ